MVVVARVDVDEPVVDIQVGVEIELGLVEVGIAALLRPRRTVVDVVAVRVGDDLEAMLLHRHVGLDRDQVADRGGVALHLGQLLRRVLQRRRECVDRVDLLGVDGQVPAELAEAGMEVGVTLIQRGGGAVRGRQMTVESGLEFRVAVGRIGADCPDDAGAGSAVRSRAREEPADHARAADEERNARAVGRQLSVEVCVERVRIADGVGRLRELLAEAALLVVIAAFDVDGVLRLVAGLVLDLLQRLPVVDAGHMRLGANVADLDLHDLIVDHPDRIDRDVDSDGLRDVLGDGLVPRPIHVVERLGRRRDAHGSAQRDGCDGTHQGLSV